jgi:hypothetical protein
MKLTIDTVAKTVEVNLPVNLKELQDQLKTMFGEAWKEYQIAQSAQTWVIPSYPVIQPYYDTRPYLTTGDFTVTL